MKALDAFRAHLTAQLRAGLPREKALASARAHMQCYASGGIVEDSHHGNADAGQMAPMADPNSMTIPGLDLTAQPNEITIPGLEIKPDKTDGESDITVPGLDFSQPNQDDITGVTVGMHDAGDVLQPDETQVEIGAPQIADKSERQTNADAWARKAAQLATEDAPVEPSLVQPGDLLTLGAGGKAGLGVAKALEEEGGAPAAKYVAGMKNPLYDELSGTYSNIDDWLAKLARSEAHTAPHGIPTPRVPTPAPMPVQHFATGGTVLDEALPDSLSGFVPGQTPVAPLGGVPQPTAAPAAPAIPGPVAGLPVTAQPEAFATPYDALLKQYDALQKEREEVRAKAGELGARNYIGYGLQGLGDALNAAATKGAAKPMLDIEGDQARRIALATGPVSDKIAALSARAPLAMGQAQYTQAMDPNDPGAQKTSRIAGMLFGVPDLFKGYSKTDMQAAQPLIGEYLQAKRAGDALKMEQLKQTALEDFQNRKLAIEQQKADQMRGKDASDDAFKQKRLDDTNLRYFLSQASTNAPPDVDLAQRNVNLIGNIAPTLRTNRPDQIQRAAIASEIVKMLTGGQGTEAEVAQFDPKSIGKTVSEWRTFVTGNPTPREQEAFMTGVRHYVHSLQDSSNRVLKAYNDKVIAGGKANLKPEQWERLNANPEAYLPRLSSDKFDVDGHEPDPTNPAATFGGKRAQ